MFLLGLMKGRFAKVEIPTKQELPYPIYFKIISLMVITGIYIDVFIVVIELLMYLTDTHNKPFRNYLN